MNQKSVGLYPPRKGLSKRAIHNDLLHALRSDAASYSAVKKHFHTANYTASDMVKTRENDGK
jgi:hypothetical protein